MTLRDDERLLAETLSDPQTKIPCLHIFDLLNLLKQICNHPALVSGEAAAFGEHDSGKWDLFTELLGECTDSGRKIVIYSQYLTMIEIITHYLSGIGIDFATLTGASRERGKIIERFNQDPEQVKTFTRKELMALLAMPEGVTQ